MITVTVQCNSSDCEWKVEVPLMVQAPYPSLGTVCPGCQQGMLLVHGIQQPSITRAELVVESTPIPEPSDQFGPFYTGGPEVFTAFQNRISPAIMILQLMEDLANDEGKVSIHSLYEQYTKTSGLIYKHLHDRVELPMKVKRGQRLSDGFPPLNTKPDPLRIVLRNVIGMEKGRIFYNRGLLQNLELIRAIDDNHFQLTERANVFLSLPNIQHYLIFLENPSVLSSRPILPEYYPEEFALKILGGIFSVAPDQQDWCLHIMQTMSENTTKNGWNSNQYAAEETDQAANGTIHPRWIHANGTPLYTKYLDQGKRQGNHNPEGHARRRLENHINGKLGSLLSLMKELGLVHPIAVGNSKNYELSSRGRKVLADHTEVIE
ncbi:hypothetical protein N9M83_01005 [Candidatus Poseidonia alphae]|nr:hypothetical protein [Candidatus Poseidonia alphae]